MRTVLVLLFLVLILAACGGAGDPAETVERYLQAKVAGDRQQIQTDLCSEMESVLEREARTFESVSGVELEGMACQLAGDGGGDEAVVSCDGRIVALYGAEETEFPLVAYRVVQEDGEWKWCGEAAAP
jgi:hypothetical protein